MCHPAILGRRLDRPVINLGFSGNGTMDAEIGTLLAELDPAIYVIDCLPNMDAKTVAERTGPLVARSAKTRPTTPILLVEDRTYADAFLIEGKAPQERGEPGRRCGRRTRSWWRRGIGILLTCRGRSCWLRMGRIRWTARTRRTWASCIRRTRFRRRWNPLLHADGAGAAGNDPVGRR